MLVRVQERLAEMWSEEKDAAGEGSGVVWRWWEWIGSGDFLDDLKLLQDGTLRSVTSLRTVSGDHRN